MDRIAQATAADRAELFRSAAAALRPERSPAIIEKDFWVCWTLHRIYAVMKFQPELIFKGGTSLSKAYNAIERFSEDVDLSISRRHLGFTDSRDPEEEGISGKESRRRIAALILTCQETVRNRLLPKLREDFASVIGKRGWSIELDTIDPQTVIFTYPRSEPAGRRNGRTLRRLAGGGSRDPMLCSGSLPAGVRGRGFMPYPRPGREANLLGEGDASSRGISPADRRCWG